MDKYNISFKKIAGFLSCFDNSQDTIAILNNFKNLSKNIQMTTLVFKTPILAWKDATIEQKQKAINDLIESYKRSKYEQTIAVVVEDIGIAVIDIDNIEKFESTVSKIDEFLENVKQDALLIEKSLTKGYHIYVREDILHSYLKTETWPNNKYLLETYGFEIRYQGLIICYPSIYRKDNIIYQTKLIYTNKDNLNKTKYDSDALQEIIRLCNLQLLENDYNIIQQEQKAYQERTEEAKKYKITNEVIQQIKERVKITDIATNLKRKQGYWLTNCPLHLPDKNPSFAIKEYSGIQKGFCFHEWRSLDVIDFYRVIHNVDFKTAIIELAKIAGIELEEREINKKEEEIKTIKAMSEEITKEDIDKFIEKINELKTIENVMKYIQMTDLYRENEDFQKRIENFLKIKDIIDEFIKNIKINENDDVSQKIQTFKTETFSIENNTYFLKDFLNELYENIQSIKEEIKSLEHFDNVFGLKIIENFPIPDTCGNPDYFWNIKDGELVCKKIMKDKIKEITRKPFFIITHRLVNHQRKVVGYRLKKIDGQVFTIGSNLQSKEVDEILADHGIPVSKKETMSNYLVSYWMANQDEIPDLLTIDSTGWYEDDYHLPQMTKYEFSNKNLIEGYTKSGSKEKELELMKKLTNNYLGLGYVMAFASTLVHLVRQNNLIFYVQGANNTGKSTLSRIGLSVFGNHEKQEDTIYNTRTMRELTMATKKDVLILFDELNLATKDKEMETAQLIYEYFAGQGKGRATKDLTIRDKLRYRGAIAITAETELDALIEKTKSDVNGIVRRTVCIDVSNFQKVDKSLFKEIYDSISKNHGNLIKDWIAFIKKKDNLLVSYDDYVNFCLSKKITNGIERNFAILYLTVDLMAECFKINTDGLKNILDIIAQDNVKLLNKRSTFEDKEQIQEAINKFIQMNYDKGRWTMTIGNGDKMQNIYDERIVRELYFVQHLRHKEWFYFTSLGLERLAEYMRIPLKRLTKILLAHNISEPSQNDTVLKRTTVYINKPEHCYLLRLGTNPENIKEDIKEDIKEPNNTDTSIDNFVDIKEDTIEDDYPDVPF